MNIVDMGSTTAEIQLNPDRPSDDRIPIAHEELRINKQSVETGRVQVRTRVDERTAWVREELAREDVQVEWVEVNREVDAAPEIRTEGDTLIIPLFEEVLVVEKRLVLRKEIHLIRRSATQPYEAPVQLRRLDADISRVPPPRTDLPAQETPMTRTLTALYDTRDHAEQARQHLLSAGLAPDNVTLAAAEQRGEPGDRSASKGGGGIMQTVKHFFMPEEDHHAYAEGMNRGGVLLTAQAPEGQEDRAIDILDRSGAVDFEARQAEWRDSGWRRPAGGEGVEPDRDVTIPIAEERLQVGKREVDRGSVRVRSYVSEQPVSEQVQLREEHVNVERRPVNEPISGSPEGIFEERSFEVAERGEEAVVGKETVVTEELHVGKQADERTETVQDTVRRTEVDVDDQRGRTQRPDQGSGASPPDRP